MDFRMPELFLPIFLHFRASRFNDSLYHYTFKKDETQQTHHAIQLSPR